MNTINAKCATSYLKWKTATPAGTARAEDPTGAWIWRRGG